MRDELEKWSAGTITYADVNGNIYTVEYQEQF